MEDNSILAFVEPQTVAAQSQTAQPNSSFIKVIGVGGGGGNAVNHMYRQGISGVDFLVCNIDRQALDNSSIPESQRILIGTGLGAGARPDVAERAAEAKADYIKEILSKDTKMLFITATLGGGTGTGASPVIARIAKEIELDDEEIRKILVVAVVTMPFKWELNKKMNLAKEGLKSLRQYADAILVIDNEKLRSFGDLDIHAGFNKANDVLLIAAKSISEIITRNDYVNTDFRDVNSILANSGTAYMGTGIGKGDDRALQAIQAATDSQLLNDTDISGAQNVLFYVSYPANKAITMDELSCITTFLQQRIGDDDANMIWGLGTDESLSDELKVTIVATGFDKTEQNTQISTVTSVKKPESATTGSPVGGVSTAPTTPQPEKMVYSKPEAVVTETGAAVEEHDIEDIKLKSDPQPKVVVEHAPAVPAGKRYTLDEDDMPETIYDENNVAPVASSEQPVATAPSSSESVEMAVVNTASAPAPVAEVKAEPAQQSFWGDNVASLFGTSTSDNNNSTQVERLKDRSERIKMMNQMLHNDPDGPAKVEQMNPMTNTAKFTFPFDNNYSQRSEITPTVHADGSITQPSNFFRQKPD